MRLNRISLGTKILISQAVTGGLLLLLGITAVVSMISIDKKLKLIVETDSRKLELSGAIARAVSDGESGQQSVLLGAMTANEAAVRSGLNQIARSKETIESSMRELERLLYTEAGRRAFAELKPVIEEWIGQLPAFQNHIAGQRFDEATKMQTAVFAPLMEKLHQRSATLSDVQRTLMRNSSDGASWLMSFVNWFTIGLCLISGCVSAGALWVVRSSNVSLRRIAGELDEGSRQVASAARQVSSSSQALAQGASEQAATLEETSASTEELTSMTQKNAENSSTAALETEKADQLLKETDHKLDQMIESMKEINTSSEKISKIIRVIDEIAFQTNILALNAAVEAARAGEAGMGFAVVADEVRNLAQRCAQAAKDTSDLIEESIVRSNEGKVRLDEVAASIARVVENASRIRLVSNEVHVGSQEQARGIEQIARAVTQMQQVTQSTAASAEQGASAGQQMSAQAQTLEESVEQLRALVGGGEDTPRRASTHSRPAAVPPAVRPAVKSLATVARPAARAAHRIPLEGDFQDF